ncbi:ParB family protein [Escherichia coli]|uniref:ParB family protein n=1 Tax=Escherichia coli TaxID=562 RepID=UPI000CDDAE88|nr:ParB family protein [Escherichia coli]POS52064.1 chromosome partitioning protein ParB [Escherichia coli]
MSIKRNHSVDLGAAIMQPGRQTSTTGNVVALGETPMILTLDQLRPNPDNPRTTRNPRYDDIKSSIFSRGLDTVPKVTRIPESEPDIYIFSDGGNTRYQILKELWEETGDQRFYRIHVLFKPWPGRLQCVIGHLAENEVRGELTFIEKARGIHNARMIYEESMQRTVTIRELASLLTDEGLPVSHSSVSRMEHTLKYLYPWIPDLLESGLGRPQINSLLSLRQDAERIWGQFAVATENGADFDRWLLELDPRERNRRHHFGEPEPVLIPADSDAMPEPATDGVSAVTAEKNSGREQSVISAPADHDTVMNTEQSPAGKAESSVIEQREERRRKEVQPDMYGGEETYSGDYEEDGDTRDAADLPVTSPEEGAQQSSGEIFSEPVFSVGELDDIEYLQNEAFHLAWELASHTGCVDELAMDRESELSAGFGAAEANCSPVMAFLVRLTGEEVLRVNPVSLDALMIGGSTEEEPPLLDDEHAGKLLRLLGVLRRLRGLQRQVEEENVEGRDE